ncbi:hypothetical protein SARC_11997 [Sphaeroforma arctica JP610]|uniref:MRH domain-containing protein n=1 Tax=Sphaeroforma arctica JP610 TaxID=667725 RepID=A0A0L0FHF8_9EUKA|nr:hypothetical protein SARC_11997 [Sphaeroforma arctica JP610]KNC75478.1 hypothetical protein SARC_11997 [Sphaeroforma arctica JP610]|eukprot:XP_014149380.1 hypothetical protein SARC_11997 [Sphaeroforma arctica JP610]
MCCLPSQREDEQENPQTNTEPEAIIAALIGTCIDYSDGFWSYEFCIGGSLRQFLIAQQTDPETQIKHDYSLGTYTNTSVTAQASDSSTADTVEEKDTPSPNPGHAGGSSSDPPLLQWGGLRFPYFEWKYEEGTICDVTGSPRKTSVRFICMQGVPEMTMLSLQESVTCVYTAIVAVPELCTHEKFRTSSGKYYDLKCYLPDEAERFEAVRSSARRRAAAMNIPHVTNWGLPKVMPADWKDPLTVRQRGLVADEPVQYQKIRADMIMDLLKDLQAQ